MLPVSISFGESYSITEYLWVHPYISEYGWVLVSVGEYKYTLVSRVSVPAGVNVCVHLSYDLF